jgi:hypothetical protein
MLFTDPFLLVCLGCFGILIIFSVINCITNQTGSWNDSYFFLDDIDDFARDANKKTSKGEEECRRVLQSIFNRSFASTRPDFLRNEVTGGLHNLELDCYNEELNLAVEYQGIQHVKFTPYFHKNYEAFLNQKYRDDMKRRICAERGVKLIEVPHTVKHGDIRNYIIRELQRVR